MTIEEVIRDFATTGPTLPCESMEWALGHWKEAAPALIELVERYTGEWSGPVAKDRIGEAVFFAVHLFGHKAEQRAFPAICRLIRAAEPCEDALGDATTKTLPQIIVSTYDDDWAALAGVIEDEAAGEFVRYEALLATAYLTRTGRIAHEDMRPFLLHLYAKMRPQTECLVWVGWAAAVAALGYDDLSDRVERLFRRRFIGRHVMGIEDFRADLRNTLDDPASMAVFASEGVHPFGDAIEELSQWYYFTDRYRADQARYAARLAAEEMRERLHPEPADDAIARLLSDAFRDVGRNDPCPCGSGKKYKECCLPKPNTTLDE